MGENQSCLFSESSKGCPHGIIWGYARAVCLKNPKPNTKHSAIISSLDKWGFPDAPQQLQNTSLTAAHAPR